jgi:galactokinase
VNGQLIAQRLVERGLDASSVEDTATLYNQAIGAFGRLNADPPRHAWWVPGRLEVFGKHTDYAGGRTLVAAVPRGFAFVASSRGDDIVRVADGRDAQDVCLDSSGTRKTFTGWRHYAEVVVARLARNFPGAHLGADVIFMSNLPRASGMSSSSALVVGLAIALVRLAGIAARDEWRANIRNAIEAAGYFACIENGMTFGGLEGDAGVGTHGGSEDHVAMICGVPGALSAYSFVPIRHLCDVTVPADWRFVIASSGVRAEKTGSSQDAYNRLSDGSAALLRLWNAAETTAPSLAAATGSSPDAVARLRRIVRNTGVPGWSPDALERRLDHFLREDARVAAAVEAMSRADRAAFGRLATASQLDAEALLGNQIADTVALARTAPDHGAFAACSFGAGFGGSVWALTDRAQADALAASWHAATFIATPSPAATEVV